MSRVAPAVDVSAEDDDEDEKEETGSILQDGIISTSEKGYN